MDLIEAVDGNNVDKVKQLIDVDKANVNYLSDNNLDTPILVAARRGYTDIGLLLVEAGADCGYTPEGLSPLMWASSLGRTDFVIFLLEQNDIKIDAQESQSGRTALWYASHAGWYDITELLLESGADPNLPLHNPPLIATVEGRTSDITTISVLVSSPNINLDYQDNLGRTALLWAVSKGRSDVVQVLLEAGANPNIGNHEDRTPLMMSVVISNVVMTKLLLDYGADVNDQDFAGRTALHYSVNTISPTVILDRDNVDLDIQDNLGRTPLIDAVDHNDVRAVSLLVEAGADPLVADNRGNTALYYAGRNDTLHEVISDAVEDYTERYNVARDSLSSKLAVAKMSVSTFGQRQIPEFIVRQSEYNSLCSVLSKNTKPNIQALAKSLNITIFNKSKTMLCQEITQKLKL